MAEYSTTEYSSLVQCRISVKIRILNLIADRIPNIFPHTVYSALGFRREDEYKKNPDVRSISLFLYLIKKNCFPWMRR